VTIVDTVPFTVYGCDDCVVTRVADSDSDTRMHVLVWGFLNSGERFSDLQIVNGDTHFFFLFLLDDECRADNGDTGIYHTVPRIVGIAQSLRLVIRGKA
jgi:hypothetical protein